MKYAKNYGDEADNDLYDNDDDELFDIFKHNSLNKAGYVNLEEQETEVKPERFNRKMGLKAMDLNIEQMYEQKNNRMSLNKAKKKSAFLPEKAIKKSSKLPQPKQFELETEQTEEIPVEKQTISNKEETITKLMKKKWFDKPIFQDLLLPNSSNSFKNPLNAPNPEPNPDEDEDIPKKPLAKAKKQSQNPLDSEEEADKYVIKVPLSEMEKRRRRLKRQRQKDSRKEVDKEGEFEVVSPTNHRFEDYDIDSAAETLALAKRMLRKKDREAIIDSTYSKYAFEDQDEAPKWFREDELAHNHLILPITKEEFQAEKERLYSINNRSSKKVMEAKIRNFKRAEKKFKKTKQKAEVIFEQEGISEGIKARQIRKLYKKDADGLKKKKKYVVGRKGSAGPGKNSRSMKFVDKRLRKDTKRERDNSKKKGPGVQRRIKKFKGQSKYNRRRK